MLARLDRLRVCWRKSSVVQSSTATPTTGQVSRLIAAHRRSVSWRGNRRLAQDLALFTQVPVLAAQPAEFVTLGRGEAIVAAAGIQVGALDPLLARGLGQLQFLGDLADRLAGRADQLNDLGLVLRRKNRRGRSIGLHLRGQALILGVHQPGSTPGSSWRARWVIVVAVMVAPACRSSAERCCQFVWRGPPVLGGGCCHHYHPDRMMCSLVAPPTMASWADERRSVRGEELEEVGRSTTWSWSGVRAATPARRDWPGGGIEFPSQPRRLDALPVRQWVRREGLHERCAPEDAQALES